MRPAGEVRQALLTAARELATPVRGVTQRELAGAAQVGFDVARRTVDNMVRAGDLVPAGERRVEYRNRPVTEYLPADLMPACAPGHANLAAAISFWDR